VLAAVAFGQQTQTETATRTQTQSTTPAAQCQFLGHRPDASCTPGAVFSGATVGKVCAPGYTKQVPNVTASVRAKVYAEYAIARHSPGQYEVDRLIPVELGGANSIKNLWPQPASPTPGYHQKDRLEHRLHDWVCAGVVVTLRRAQKLIRTNWVSAYHRYVGP